MSLFDEFSAEGQANISAADDQDAHDRIEPRGRHATKNRMTGPTLEQFKNSSRRSREKYFRLVTSAATALTP